MITMSPSVKIDLPEAFEIFIIYININIYLYILHEYEANSEI